MKLSRKIIFGLGLVVLAPAAVAGTAFYTVIQAPPQETDVWETLSGIRYSPGKSNLDSVFGAPVEELIQIAEDTSADADTGLRIRAFRALGHYGDSDQLDLALASLQGAVDRYQSAQSGSDLLLLRAAMNALVELQDAGSVGRLATLLNHTSRDIRAAAATGLGRLGGPDAEAALRERYAVEDQAQVKIAITAALQSIGAAN
jgi:HEAT repeat protein